MRQKLVNNIFSSVASKYDLMNDLMSLGAHRLWKREMMKLLPDKSMSLLDIAGGTGDIAYNYLRQARKDHKLDHYPALSSRRKPGSHALVQHDIAKSYNNLDPGFRRDDALVEPSVTLCDINLDMLLVGRDRLIDQGQVAGLSFVVGNAECLPLKNNSFDYCTIAFGIRNVTNIKAALKETYRVLKPGGKFVCMEFSPPSDSVVHKLYDAYSFSVIPKIGKFITGNRQVYEYLVESIRQFPTKEEFLDMINKSGFVSSAYKVLSLGIVAIHYGYKK